MDGAAHHGVFVFERCRLDPVSRTLTRDGARITLQPRLFDVLLYLVQNPGRVLERDELLAAVWPGRTVDESNLGRAISSLRQGLEAHGVAGTLIVTAPGRGYRFGARVDFETAVVETAPASIAAAPASAAPARRRIGAVLLLCGLAVLGLLALLLPWHRAGNLAEAQRFAPPPRSVASLPFITVNGLGGGPAEKDYLAEGLSQELINELGRVADIRVAARAPSVASGAKPVPVRDIARQLNVGMVLEGSLRHEGGHLHITAELVDATTGFLVWTRNYDSAPTDLLTVEGQIAAKVVTSLKGSMADDDPVSLALGGTTNAGAFDAYLSGMVLMGPTNGEANQAATDAFTRAIALDPEYSEALVARAGANLHGRQWRRHGEPVQGFAGCRLGRCAARGCTIAQARRGPCGAGPGSGLPSAGSGPGRRGIWPGGGARAVRRRHGDQLCAVPGGSRPYGYGGEGGDLCRRARPAGIGV
jgi:DNA-binding winged helix-turn-helix (wHTH) protein/TolB-like protein